MKKRLELVILFLFIFCICSLIVVNQISSSAIFSSTKDSGESRDGRIGILNFLFPFKSFNEPHVIGCVGETKTFVCGDYVTESCTMNGDLIFNDPGSVCFKILNIDNLVVDGNGHSITLINAQNVGAGIQVSNDNNIVKNFVVKNFDIGIFLSGKNSKIFNNTILNYTYQGIVISNLARNNSIDNNYISDEITDTAYQRAIAVQMGPQFNNITNNYILLGRKNQNVSMGIYIDDIYTNNTLYNLFLNNEIHNRDGGMGIRIDYANHNSFIGNKLYDNSDLTIYNSDYNNISRNKFYNFSNRDAISFRGGSFNIVDHNEIYFVSPNNVTSIGGIFLVEYTNGAPARENKIFSNKIQGDCVGIGMTNVNENLVINNLIYDNLFNTTENFYNVYNSPNFWNTVRSPGPNILGGRYFGGNVWTNPSGTGFSDTCIDRDRNGFCDQPFILTTYPYENIDNLPLAINSKTAALD